MELSPAMEWLDGMAAAVTVCDRAGIILYMNERACETFAKDGGAALLGKSLLDCHPAKAREKLSGLLASGLPNSYTIEKNGIWKMIQQMPWFSDGALAGLVELSFEIPAFMPHFNRDVKK